MHGVEIPRNEWSTALNQFSAAHQGWLVSLDLLDATNGLREEIRNLPLLGITAERTKPGTDITIAAARSPSDHITHTISAPTQVRFDRTDDGVDEGLRIASANGTVAILRFHIAEWPENSDGTVRR